MHLRRVLVLFAFAVWQGGFFFYASVVVPVGTDVLGSAAAQGTITRRVTNWLNFIGVIGLIVTAWDQSRTRDPRSRRVATRWWTWSVMLVCQYLLFFLHQVLDYFMSPDGTRIVIRPFFRPVHEAYLWACTVQWAAGLVMLWLMLKAWSAEDREKADLK